MPPALVLDPATTWERLKHWDIYNNIPNALAILPHIVYHIISKLVPTHSDGTQIIPALEAIFDEENPAEPDLLPCEVEIENEEDAPVEVRLPWKDSVHSTVCFLAKVLHYGDRARVETHAKEIYFDAGMDRGVDCR